MKTKTIDVLSVTNGTLSNSDGLSLKIAVDNILLNGDTVILSFSNINAISSSFLNSSIGEIVSKYGFSILKNKIKIVNYSSSIANLIISYIKDLKSLEYNI